MLKKYWRDLGVQTMNEQRKCECVAVGSPDPGQGYMGGGCCKGTYPAALIAKRDGQPMALCTYCILSTDERVQCLVAPRPEDREPFLALDPNADDYLDWP
jgi:hypothetical protein